MPKREWTTELPGRAASADPTQIEAEVQEWIDLLETHPELWTPLHTFKNARANGRLWSQGEGYTKANTRARAILVALRSMEYETMQIAIRSNKVAGTVTIYGRVI